MAELSKGEIEAILANPLSPSIGHLASLLTGVDAESTKGIMPHPLSQTFPAWLEIMCDLVALS